VPPFGIFSDAYTRAKVEGILAHAKLDNCALDLDSCLHGQLADRVLAFWGRREEIRHRLEGLLPAWQAERRAHLRWIIGDRVDLAQTDCPPPPSFGALSEQLPALMVLQHAALLSSERCAAAKANERDLVSAYLQSQISSLEFSMREQASAARETADGLQRRIDSLEEALRHESSVLEQTKLRFERERERETLRSRSEKSSLERSLAERDAMLARERERIVALEHCLRERWLGLARLLKQPGGMASRLCADTVRGLMNIVAASRKRK
jgi:hypothetical protein